VKTSDVSPLTTRAELKTEMPEYWVARLVVRDNAPTEIDIKGYITKPDELFRFIEKLKTLAAHLPDDMPPAPEKDETPERSLPIMPRQRGGLTRAAAADDGGRRSDWN
jgi:CBS domain-containing protein